MRHTSVVVVWLALFPCVSLSHHSGAAVYIPTETIAIRGEITRIFWRNPHVHVLVRVANAGGEEAVWDVESNSVSILGRMGITSDMIRVGDQVRVAGWPARRPVNEMFATNLLLPAGEELLLMAGSPAVWSDETVGSTSAWLTDGEAADSEGATRGIFRVWSTNMGNPESFPLFNDVMAIEEGYPLTESARAARAAWDPLEGNPYLSCSPMGMPRVMGQPYPIEFVDDGDSIVMRIELYDTERRIWLDADRLPDEGTRSILGHSVGHWEGEALVVETTRISWPYFDQSGVPLSADAVVLERFTPSSDESRLDYVITVTDPQTFTEPVTLKKYWTWRSNEQIQPFNCQEFEAVP